MVRASPGPEPFETTCTVAHQAAGSGLVTASEMVEVSRHAEWFRGTRLPWVMLDAPTHLSSGSRLSPPRASFRASHPRVRRGAQVGVDVGGVVRQSSEDPRRLLRPCRCWRSSTVDNRLCGGFGADGGAGRVNRFFSSWLSSAASKASWSADRRHVLRRSQGTRQRCFTGPAAGQTACGLYDRARSSRDRSAALHAGSITHRSPPASARRGLPLPAPSRFRARSPMRPRTARGALKKFIELTEYTSRHGYSDRGSAPAAGLGTCGIP